MNISPGLKAKFTELTNLAEDALAAARLLRDTELVNEPVRWTRAKIEFVEFFVTDEGTKGFRIHVCKAAPNCAQLCTFMHRFIMQATTVCTANELEIVTDW